MKTSAILTEQDFRDAISKQCGFTLQLEDRKFDEKSEHENDLRYESLMADESEYGPVCNERDEVGSRQ